MENSEHFVSVAKYYADCAKTGDKKLIEQARNSVNIVLDCELCKREVTEKPNG